MESALDHDLYYKDSGSVNKGHYVQSNESVSISLSHDYTTAPDPRVIRRHRIGRTNAMASVARDEAFLSMECIKKCAVQGRT